MPNLIAPTYAPQLTPNTPHKWQDDAACIGHDPEAFFPDNGDTQTTRWALDICAGCPVIAQCRQLGDGYEWGVFGGATPLQRRKAQGPWRSSRTRQLELAKKGVPVSEIARLCQVTEKTVERTIKSATKKDLDVF